MRRYVAACGSARIPTGVLATVTVVVSLMLVPVAGQAQPATTDTWTPPRTPWGDPDLQGIWDFRTLTPLERPRRLAGQEFFTEEEAAEREQRAERRRVNSGFIVGTFEPAGTTLTADRRTSLLVDPPDGTPPVWTPEAQALGAAAVRSLTHGPENRVLSERCIVGGTHGAPLLPSIFPENHNVQLFQTPGYVVLLIEMIHVARVVPLDGRPHVGQDIRLWLGDSRGRWEGNTLVVDTTNFNAKGLPTPAFQYGWWPSETQHLVERFTRVDADTITYEFTVADPKYPGPWSAALPMKKTEGPLYEFACHEGNYAMAGILSGARAQERQEAASR